MLHRLQEKKEYGQYGFLFQNSLKTGVIQLSCLINSISNAYISLPNICGLHYCAASWFRYLTDFSRKIEDKYIWSIKYGSWSLALMNINIAAFKTFEK